MSGSNNSGSNTSKMAVPQAKGAMNRFKQEVASEDVYKRQLCNTPSGTILTWFLR